MKHEEIKDWENIQQILRKSSPLSSEEEFVSSVMHRITVLEEANGWWRKWIPSVGWPVP